MSSFNNIGFIVNLPPFGFLPLFFGAGVSSNLFSFSFCICSSSDFFLRPLFFLITGSFLKADLPMSVGFINIPAFLIFIPITMFMARIGANTVHKLDKSKLQSFFGIFLYVVGTIFLYRYLNL